MSKRVRGAAMADSSSYVDADAFFATYTSLVGAVDRARDDDVTYITYRDVQAFNAFAAAFSEMAKVAETIASNMQETIELPQRVENDDQRHSLRFRISTNMSRFANGMNCVHYNNELLSRRMIQVTKILDDTTHDHDSDTGEDLVPLAQTQDTVPYIDLDEEESQAVDA